VGKADWISGIFWLIFSLIVSIESYRVGLGTLHKPGPGFLFFWTSIFLGIMSLITLVRGWRTKKDRGSGIPIFGKLNITKIILVLISAFLYALLMETLGFILVTLLLFIFLLRAIEKKAWLLTISVSITVSAIAYLIFETWLKCQLPKGFLMFLRF
jgi:putative tricarboxylic transport membrane protein